MNRDAAYLVLTMVGLAATIALLGWRYRDGSASRARIVLVDSALVIAAIEMVADSVGWEVVGDLTRGMFMAACIALFMTRHEGPP